MRMMENDFFDFQTVAKSMDYKTVPYTKLSHGENEWSHAAILKKKPTRNVSSHRFPHSIVTKTRPSVSTEK
ncbi:hypothetical protein J6590_098476, partial [Homalodisca vitripennis]